MRGLKRGAKFGRCKSLLLMCRTELHMCRKDMSVDPHYKYIYI